MAVHGVVAHLPGVGRNRRREWGGEGSGEDEWRLRDGDRRLVERTQIRRHADAGECEQKQPVEHPEEDSSAPRPNEGSDGETEEHEGNERRAFDVERIPGSRDRDAEDRGAEEAARLSADDRKRDSAHERERQHESDRRRAPTNSADALSPGEPVGTPLELAREEWSADVRGDERRHQVEPLEQVQQKPDAISPFLRQVHAVRVPAWERHARVDPELEAGTLRERRGEDGDDGENDSRRENADQFGPMLTPGEPQHLYFTSARLDRR